MEGIIDPLVSNDQSVVINNENPPCMSFSKSEDIMPLDDRDDKSDTNSSSLSSIVAEENGIGNYCLKHIFIMLIYYTIILFFNDLERHSNPTNCVLNTVDGLLPLVDDVQNRLQQINLEHKVNLIYLFDRQSVLIIITIFGCRLEKLPFKMNCTLLG